MEKHEFTHTEANLLPDDHEVNITYNTFWKSLVKKQSGYSRSKDKALFEAKHLMLGISCK